MNPYEEVIPQLDVFRRIFGLTGEAVYNDFIMAGGRRGLTCLLYYAVVIASIVLQGARGRRLFRAHFERTGPDLVLSVMPLINRAVADTVPEGVPFLVLMTDWQEMSRHSWFPRGRDYYALCGTPEGLAQLEDGRRGRRVIPLSGLPIRREFLEAEAPDEAAPAPAFDADRPTLCFLYGGGGSRRMLALGDALAASGFEGQAEFLCGHDASLEAELRARSWPFPTRVLGFTRAVHTHLRRADVFVGKPGPACVTEALASGAHLLLDASEAMPQERCILRSIRAAGRGRSFRSAQSFLKALDQLLEAPAPRTRREDSGGGNRAILELPGILEQILAGDQIRPEPKAQSPAVK